MPSKSLVGSKPSDSKPRLRTSVGPNYTLQHVKSPLVASKMKQKIHIYRGRHTFGLLYRQQLELERHIQEGKTVGVLKPGFKKVKIAKTLVGLKRILGKDYIKMK